MLDLSHIDRSPFPFTFSWNKGPETYNCPFVVAIVLPDESVPDWKQMLDSLE